jgi:hypothetical protein
MVDMAYSEFVKSLPTMKHLESSSENEVRAQLGRLTPAEVLPGFVFLFERASEATRPVFKKIMLELASQIRSTSSS